MGELPTKEWIILTQKLVSPAHAKRPGARWVEGLSACLPDEVRDTRKLDRDEKDALKLTKAEEREWIVSLADGSEAAHTDLLGIMRTLSQRRFVTPAHASASALAGATLLGRGRGGGRGLSTPPPGPKVPASVTGSALSLRPRRQSAAATASTSEPYSHIRVRLGAPPLGKDWTARATHEACCVHRRARMLWSMNSLQLSIWPCAKWTLAPLKR